MSLPLAVLCRVRVVASDLSQRDDMSAVAELSSLHVETRGWNKVSSHSGFPKSLACVSPLDLCIANTGREGRFSVVILLLFYL